MRRIVHDGEGVTADGEIVRVPLMVTDGATFDAAAHKPGFRLANKASTDARELAYAEYCRRTADAWKLPMGAKRDIEAAAEGGPNAAMAADDAQAIRDLAYASYVQRVTNAWRGGDA